MKNFFAKNKIYLFRFMAVVISIAFMLTIAEVTLYFLEKHHLDYGETLKQKMGRGGFLKENFNDLVIGGYYGSKVRWKNNSAGFRSDLEFSENPGSDYLRILSIGDSFTAGYRVGQEETFSFLLEKQLNSKYGKTEVLISEVKDPVTGLNYLKNFGQLYHPHIVLLGITLGNDIAQSYARRVQGLQRSLEEYEIPGKCLNHTEWTNDAASILKRFQRISRVLNRFFNLNNAIASYYGEFNHPKLFDAINGLGVYLKSPPPEIDEAYNQLFRALLGFKAFSKKKDILFAAALFPQRFQIQPKDWEYTIKAYRLKESCFDTLLPNTRIKKFCDDNSIRCLDPTEEMAAIYKENNTSLYFPRGDMHWNKFGHKAFFESAQDSFSELVEIALNRQKK